MLQPFSLQQFLVTVNEYVSLTESDVVKARSHDPILSDPIVLDPIVGSYEHA